MIRQGLQGSLVQKLHDAPTTHRFMRLSNETSQLVRRGIAQAEDGGLP
jgi:hypothetical protein